MVTDLFGIRVELWSTYYLRVGEIICILVVIKITPVQSSGSSPCFHVPIFVFVSFLYTSTKLLSLLENAFMILLSMHYRSKIKNVLLFLTESTWHILQDNIPFWTCTIFS